MRQRRIIPETRGDVLIRVLWEIQTDAIIGVRISKYDAETYVKEGMDKILPRWEQIKKENHRQYCN